MVAAGAAKPSYRRRQINNEKEKTMKKYLPHGCVLAAGILWGLIGIFSRRLTGAGFSPRSIVLVRNLGGLAILGLMFALADRSLFKIKAKHLPIFFGTGVVSLLLFMLCYFSCQQMCSLAVAGSLLYTSPAFVVVLSAILWRDKLTKKKIAALVIALLGCTFVTGLWTGDLTVTLQGALFGVGSGFFYGLYSIFGRFALKHYKPYTVTFYTFVFAGAGSLCVMRPAELAAGFAVPGAFWFAVGLVVVSTVVPFLLYTKGLADLESGKAAILACIEPVTSAVVGVAVFGEPMSIMVLLGLLFILISVYILR